MSTEDSTTADAAVVLSSRTALVRYLGAGILSYVVDTGLLLLISGPLGQPVWLAATIGFWTSVLLNFALNRATFSQDGGSTLRHGVRYAVLLAANYAVTLVIVTVGVAHGLTPFIPKTIAVGLTTITNFLLYRRWVFR
ncbi:GtrA family protein [Cellulomonas sp. P5_E12]